MKIRFIHNLLLLSFLISFLGGGKIFADEFKRDVFLIGIQLGGAECTASLHEAFSKAERPGVLDLIRRNISWSIETSRRLGNPANALVQLSSELNNLSFAQIRQRLLNAIQTEERNWGSLNPQVSGLFVLGVHLEGAECVASHVQSFSRQDKPGSLELIQRNILWVQTEARNVNLGLAISGINQLILLIENGASFADILSRLAEIRIDWQQALESQESF